MLKGTYGVGLWPDGGRCWAINERALSLMVNRSVEFTGFSVSRVQKELRKDRKTKRQVSARRHPPAIIPRAEALRPSPVVRERYLR
jgi:hypothetical protein